MPWELICGELEYGLGKLRDEINSISKFLKYFKIKNQVFLL